MRILGGRLPVGVASCSIDHLDRQPVPVVRSVNTHFDATPNGKVEFVYESRCVTPSSRNACNPSRQAGGHRAAPRMASGLAIIHLRDVLLVDLVTN